MKRKNRFSSDFCMACCALLMPYSKVCPNCGADNSWLPRQDDPVDDDFLSQVVEDPFSESGGFPTRTAFETNSRGIMPDIPGSIQVLPVVHFLSPPFFFSRLSLILLDIPRFLILILEISPSGMPACRGG